MYSREKLRPYFGQDFQNYQIYLAKITEEGLVASLGYPKSAAIEKQQIITTFIPTGAQFSSAEDSRSVQIPVPTIRGELNCRHFMRWLQKGVCAKHQTPFRILAGMVWMAFGPKVIGIQEALSVPGGFIALYYKPKNKGVQIIRVEIDPKKTGPRCNFEYIVDQPCIYSRDIWEKHDEENAARDRLYQIASRLVAERPNACMHTPSYTFSDSVLVHAMKTWPKSGALPLILAKSTAINSIDITDRIYMRTVLHFAAMHIHDSEILRYLVKKSRPPCVDRWDLNPLEQAIQSRNSSALVALLEACEPSQVSAWWKRYGEHFCIVGNFTEGESIVRSHLARNSAQMAIDEIMSELGLNAESGITCATA